MKRKSNKKLTIALLALLGVVSTAGTYAYWAAGVSAPNNKSATNTITIGASTGSVATMITIGDVTNSDKKLVPTGFGGQENDVESISYTYTVGWVTDNTIDDKNDKGNAARKDGTLTATATVVSAKTSGGDEITGDALATIKKLVKIEITSFMPEIKLNETTVGVTFVISLEEPANETEYNQVINAVVSIKVEFEVALV